MGKLKQPGSKIASIESKCWKKEDFFSKRMNVVDLLLRKVLKVWTEKKSNYELLICDFKYEKSNIVWKVPTSCQMVDPANFKFLQKTTLFCQNQYSLQTNKRA